MLFMTIKVRQATFATWIEDGDFGADQLHMVAYRNGVYNRDPHCSQRFGFSDYLNAAAIRQLTQGEG
jgi:hypothetical protein